MFPQRLHKLPMLQFSRVEAGPHHCSRPSAMVALEVRLVGQAKHEHFLPLADGGHGSHELLKISAIASQQVSNHLPGTLVPGATHVTLAPSL